MSNTPSPLSTVAEPATPPKVFISYSWTSHAHQSTVKEWAERLLADGVDVVMDIFDLKEGHDKYVFMEKMVTDPTVTHVLMMCDKTYAAKADSREAGVGTETQIISKEVYDKANQSKFIPIACERDESGNWYLPTFLKSRIGIDFSTAEAVNENWEQLVRLLHGKPLHAKPAVGKPPAFLRDDTTPSRPALAKFSALKQAIISGKPAIEMYRQDFLDACIAYADSLRIRNAPDPANFEERVVADCAKLKLVRDHIVDWVLLEALSTPSDRFQESLIAFLERLLEMKVRPQDATSWNELWSEAHRVFVYETFLYIVAALMKGGAYGVLHEVLASHYFQPTGSHHHSEGGFASFECFWTHAELLQVLTPRRNLISPAAELVKRQADRADMTFESVMEAELMIMMMAFVSPSVRRWYPGTLLYAQHRPFPFFIRAATHKGFQKLAVIIGVDSADKLRTAVKEGEKRLRIDHWHDFRWHNRDLSEMMNIAKLDTLR
ncbi:MAG: SEFIR domain-containing protein [Phycisphaerales bacterium]